jgi:PmbA protein
VPDLSDLCRAAVEAAADGEAIEAYAEESRRTEISARKGEVEGLTFAESRGLGVRLVVAGRLGYAYTADPSDDEARSTVAKARENAALAEPDEYNVLPQPSVTEAMPQLYRDAQATMATTEKVRLAVDLERLATTTDPRVSKVDECSIGDAVSRTAIANTNGLASEYARTDAWCVAVTLAAADDETQAGYSYRIARELPEIDLEEIAVEAVARAAAMLGAQKPATARIPVVLDPFAGMSFLAVLAGGLSAEAVQKRRSVFADKLGEAIAAPMLSLVDDGRLLEGPGAAPFDDEGVATGRTELISDGRLRAYLHNSYSARRAGTTSTGNAQRAGYRSTPGVGTTNFYVEAGPRSLEELLGDADGGVLIQDVSGVHSGANPISGEFSVGATGLRIRGGATAEPLREMTIASTIPDMLNAVTAVGRDLRFFSSVGVPSILVGEMTVAGV